MRKSEEKIGRYYLIYESVYTTLCMKNISVRLNAENIAYNFNFDINQ